MRYTRNPETVEAFKFTEESEITAPDWFADAVKKEKIFIDRSLTDGAVHIYGCSIAQGKNWIKARNGDYIVKDSDGNIFPCKADKFQRHYTKEEVTGMTSRKSKKSGSSKG